MRRAALLVAFLAAACQSSTSDDKPARTVVAAVDEDADEPMKPMHKDPSTLPGPGRKLPPAYVHWSYLDPAWELPLKTLRGADLDLAQYRGKAVMFVNVASKCGLTPQYAALEAVQKKYESRGFTVVAFPCNQFGEQEPGTGEEIAEFCSATFGVTFPMAQKIEVNGADRHELYKLLTPIKDPMGYAGDIRWNFEKFVVSADGTEITRFSPRIAPDDPMVIAAIEAALPDATAN